MIPWSGSQFIITCQAARSNQASKCAERYRDHFPCAKYVCADYLLFRTSPQRALKSNLQSCPPALVPSSVHGAPFPSSSSSAHCPAGFCTSVCYTLCGRGNFHYHTVHTSSYPDPRPCSVSCPRSWHQTCHSPAPGSPASGPGNPACCTSPGEGNYRSDRRGTAIACCSPSPVGTRVRCRSPDSRSSDFGTEGTPNPRLFAAVTSVRARSRSAAVLH